MISIEIKVNGEQIFRKTAKRIAGKKGEMCLYETDDGKRIEHHYNLGAVSLAIKILEEYKDDIGKKG